MRIVFVCNQYPTLGLCGGIGTMVQTLARGLVDAGHQVTVLGLGDSGESEDRGVRLVMLPASRLRGLAWLINRRRLYRWLRREARGGGVDIIEISEFQGLLPFRFPWAPVVLRLHSSHIPISWQMRWLERRTMGLHRNWISVSEWMLMWARRKYGQEPHRATVVYNALLPASIESGGGLSDSQLPAKFILYAGRVGSLKGSYVLAQAAKRLLTRFPDVDLVYAGRQTVEEGTSSGGKILQIVGEDLASRVHLLGFVEHETVLEIIARATVFVSPSQLESFSMVVLEALRAGTPVVYADAHAGPEVIRDGVTGLLADPFDPDDLADKVGQLLEDRELAARLAENGKRDAEERFSLERCVAGTLAFYQELLEEAS